MTSRPAGLLSRGLALALLAAACLVPAAPAGAQIYRWTDERGELNLAQGLENVPERYRARAVVVAPAEPEPRPAPAPGAAGRPGGGPAGGAGPAEGVLARVPFVPGAPILVAARVNGGRSVQLILDTGASRTTISPRALSALGVDGRPTSRVRMQGVTGSAEAPMVMLESLEVGEARVAPLEVIAHDPNLTQGEGLLGRDFLDRFHVSIDTTTRVVLIGRR